MGTTETKSFADLLAAASAAKTAVNTLRSELVNPGIAVGQALDNLEETVIGVEDQIHPLTLQEVILFGDFRWLHRPHWDQWAWSIERIADACEAKVVCSEKYDYLLVEIVTSPVQKVKRRALEELANYVELISDQDIFFQLRSDSRG